MTRMIRHRVLVLGGRGNRNLPYEIGLKLMTLRPNHRTPTASCWLASSAHVLERGSISKKRGDPFSTGASAIPVYFWHACVPSPLASPCPEIIGPVWVVN